MPKKDKTDWQSRAVHLFSLYYPETSALTAQSEFVLTDSELCRRITRVLRLGVGHEVVLFDRSYHSTVRIVALKKNEVCLFVLTKQRNKVYQPDITFLLPVLKRGAFEEAICGLVACGVQSIPLLITDTTQREWYGDRELNRLRKLVIATAEQSRNYAFPIIEKPLTVSQALERYHTAETFFIYADPSAQSINQLVHEIEKNVPPSLLLTVGPEADFSPAEKELFVAYRAHSYRLTPTILRSPLAAVLLSGMCRSMFS